MPNEEEGYYVKELLTVAKKSKKDRKKVLNTCALVLRLAADDDFDENIDIETLMSAQGGGGGPSELEGFRFEMDDLA